MIHEKMEVGRNTYLFIYNILFGFIGLFRQKKTSKCFQLIKAGNPEMEFKEFMPRFKSAKTRFKLSGGLNL